MSHIKNAGMRVALLYQAIESPTINGVRKPMKPGGRHHSPVPTSIAEEYTNAQQATRMDVPILPLILAGSPASTSLGLSIRLTLVNMLDGVSQTRKRES
jgi:hypothetical protein